MAKSHPLKKIPWKNLRRKLLGASEFEAVTTEYLALMYDELPSDLECPECETPAIQVLDFLEPELLLSQNIEKSTHPEGNYLILVYCHKCQKRGYLVGPT